MKTIISTLLLLLIYNLNFAQSKKSEEDYVIKFLLTDSSELFGYDYAREIPSWDEMMTNIDYSRNFGEVGNSFYYFDIKGGIQRIDYALIDTVIVTDGSFCFVNKEFKNYGNFWSKVAENDKYILYDKRANFMIFDKGKNQIVNQNYTGHSQPGNYGLKKDIKMVEENVKPYFPNCPELFELIQKNLVKENYMDKKPKQTIGYRLFDGIANIQCD